MEVPLDWFIFYMNIGREVEIISHTPHFVDKENIALRSGEVYLSQPAGQWPLYCWVESIHFSSIVNAILRFCGPCWPTPNNSVSSVCHHLSFTLWSKLLWPPSRTTAVVSPFNHMHMKTDLHICHPETQLGTCHSLITNCHQFKRLWPLNPRHNILSVKYGLFSLSLETCFNLNLACLSRFTSHNANSERDA